MLYLYKNSTHNHLGYNYANGQKTCYIKHTLLHIVYFQIEKGLLKIRLNDRIHNFENKVR